jgi:hypothetical protein
MASINGLQNNALIVNTIDGLQTVYATSIYDNGVLLTPGNYVPYTGATSTIDANGQNLVNVANFSTLSLTASVAKIGVISTNTISCNTLSSNTISTNTITGAKGTFGLLSTVTLSTNTLSSNTLSTNTITAALGTFSSLSVTNTASAYQMNTNLMYIQSAPADTPVTYIALNGAGLVTSYTPSLPIPSTFSTVQILASTATISSIYASTLKSSTIIGSSTILSSLTTNTEWASTINFSTMTQVGTAPIQFYGAVTSNSGITAPIFTGDLTGNAGSASNVRVDAPLASTIYFAGLSGPGSGGNYRLYNAPTLFYNVSTGLLSTPNIQLSQVPTGTISSYLGINSLGSTVTGTGGGATITNIFSTLYVSTLYASTTLASTILTSTLNASTIYFSTLFGSTLNASTITVSSLFSGVVSTNQVTTASTQLFLNSGSTINLNVGGTTMMTVGSSATLLSNSGIGILTLGVNGSLNSYLNLSAGLGQFNGNIQAVGGTITAGNSAGISPYTIVSTAGIYMGNGANLVSTTSQAVVTAIGAANSAFSSDFIIKSQTTYVSTTTGINLYAQTSDSATLGQLYFNNTNSTTAGTSNMAIRLLAPSGTSGTPGALTTYVTVTSAGLVGVKSPTVLFSQNTSGTFVGTGYKTLYIRIVGGGGGGAGTSLTGGAGGTTSVSGTNITSLTALGGSGGLTYAGGAGGAVGTGNITLPGGGGSGSYLFVAGTSGGIGGASALGYGGTNEIAGGAPAFQPTNGGGGSGTYASGSTTYGGGGGGGGGYSESYISNPSGTYTVTIGSGGTGGTSYGYAGANGYCIAYGLN